MRMQQTKLKKVEKDDIELGTVKRVSRFSDD